MRTKLIRKFETLEAMRAIAERSMSGRSEAELLAPPAPGKWSAAQIVDHVMTAESRSLEYIRKKIQNPAGVPPAGVMCAVRTLALVTALSSPLRFKAPDVVSDVPDNPHPAETFRRWAEVRAQLREMLEELPEELLARALFKHPVAGRMNMSQTLDFMTSHLRRHSKQLMRVLG